MVRPDSTPAVSLFRPSRPAVVVPVVAEDAAGVAAAARAMAELPVDLVEWRVDHYLPFTASGRPQDALDGLTTLVAALSEGRALSGTPVLATFRTADEGGRAEIAAAAYVDLVAALAASGLASLVDVEHRHRGAADALAAAHAAGVPVVASNHDFDGTPPAAEIVSRLTAMEDDGADVAKIAVMPHSRADVLTLLAATEQRFRDARRPIVTMSMGALGAVTRIGGGAFGSAATFATAGAESAPGQLPVRGVRSALDLLAGP